MKLARKEIQAPHSNPDHVVLVVGRDEKAPEGKVRIDIEVARACFFSLLDPVVLQELCRLVDFQPAGFRLNRIEPTELFIQFVRYVQKKGFGVGPLVSLIDQAASDLAKADPLVFKTEILNPPKTPFIDGPDAECWAAALWLKIRAGGLEPDVDPPISELCHSWLFEKVPEFKTRVFPPAGADETVQKAKEKAGEWRDRALKAEKSLGSLRSSRDSFEQELRNAKAEVRMLRLEVPRIREELVERVSAQKRAEEKYSAASVELKEARATIARLEDELQERKKADEDGSPRMDQQELQESARLHQRLDRLQKTLDHVSARLNEVLTASSHRSAIPRHSERVMSFVDVANLDRAAQSYFQGRVDYELLARYLASRTPTGRSRTCENIAFLCLDGRPGSHAFAQTLRSLGYRVVTRKLKVFADGNTKGNVDVQLAVYAMRQTDHFDTAVIVSGDSDFACLAEVFKSGGKRVEVVSFSNLGAELRDAADEVVILDSRVLLPGAQREIAWET